MKTIFKSIRLTAVPAACRTIRNSIPITKRLFILAFLMLTVNASFAAVVKLTSGSLDALKQESAVNVVYSYEGMRVGKFVNEKDYVDKKVAEFNQKEAGRGDRWRQAWVDDRASRFQPKFEELLNKQFSGSKQSLQFGAHPDAKYTLILKTTFMEPGWDVGISAHPALVSATVLLVETKNQTNTVASLTITKAKGMGVWEGQNYDAGGRLQESYAKAGKELGILIRKKIK